MPPGRHTDRASASSSWASPNEESAHVVRGSAWPDGVRCPRCDTSNAIRCPNGPAPHCPPAILQRADRHRHVPIAAPGKWAFGSTYVRPVKGASMKLHGSQVTQKTAWFLAGIRAGPTDTSSTVPSRPMRRSSAARSHASQKLNAGRGPVGKTAVAGVKDPGQVVAAVVPESRATLASSTGRDGLHGMAYRGRQITSRRVGERPSPPERWSRSGPEGAITAPTTT